MNRNFIVGVFLALIVLGFYCIQIVNSNKLRSQTWKPEYEQLCVEDSNTKKDCLCAVRFIEQSTPSSELSGEQIYENTKDMLKGTCL